MYLVITEKMEQEIEKWFGKTLAECNDDDAKEIVEEYVDGEIECASFSTEDEIYYEFAEEDEEDDDVKPAWKEEYLNSLGMSKADF